MERTVLKYAPAYWDRCFEDNIQFDLRPSSEEYKRIAFQIKQATQNNSIRIARIERNQNIHDFGQFLIREQLIAVAKSHERYYRVPRFVTIKKHYLACALEYNLDHRRCGKARLVFQKYISCAFDDIILVVQVITNNPNSDCIEPTNSSDYFIDYIVRL